MVPSRAFPLSLSLSLFSTPTQASSSNERNETRGAQQICVIMFAKAFPKAKKKKTKTKKKKNEEKRASKGEDISLSVLIGGDFY
tara:strand:- start:1937 stop:2188 length:252 start_codon:yes stop_codon:yes gene_type:complete